MKLNWGIGIAIVYIVFVVGTVAVVLFTATVDVNLVTDDYYEKELVFQDQIDKMNRTNALPEQPIISLVDKKMYLKFPSSIDLNLVEGTINFYRPSNNSLDFSVPLKLDETGEQFVESIRLIDGMWRIYVEWNLDDQHFLNHKILMIQ